MPVPGSATVELPNGETDVYYAEAIEGDSEIPLVPPEDLLFTITDAGGAGVRVDSRGGDPESTDGGPRG